MEFENKVAIEEEREAFSIVGRTSTSKSPVNLVAPSNAKAQAPTITTSTPWRVVQMPRRYRGQRQLDPEPPHLDGPSLTTAEDARRPPRHRLNAVSGHRDGRVYPAPQVRGAEFLTAARLQVEKELRAIGGVATEHHAHEQ